MSGLKITVPGADASEYALEFIPVVPEGLVYLNFFPATAQMGRNLAPGEDGATVIGSPTVSSHFMAVTHGSNYIATQAPQTEDFTVIAVARQQSEGRGHIVGNFVDGSTSQWSLFFGDSTPGNGQVSLSFSTSMDVSGTISSDNWAAAQLGVPTGPVCIAARFDGSARAKEVDNLTAGTNYTRTQASAAAAPSANVVNVGQGQSGATSVAFVAVYDRVLSDGEVAEVYESIKPYFTARSITI